MIRIPPQAVEVEKHVIGAALLGQDPASTAVQLLKPADFYVMYHQEIFAAIDKLSRGARQADILTVPEMLKSAGKMEAAEEVMRISAEVVSAAYLVDHCQIVKDRAEKRTQIGFAAALMEKGYSGDPAAETQQFMEKMIFSIKEAAEDRPLRPIREVLSESFQAIANRRGGNLTGIPTGLEAIDRHTAGFQATDLIVVGGRPGQGKTAICAQIGVHAAKQGKVVAMFEGEMKDRAVVDRVLFAEAGVNQQTVRRGELHDRDYPKFSIAAGNLSEIPFFIQDTAGITPLEVRSKCRRLKLSAGLDLIIVDNIQRMKSDSGAKDLRVRAAEVSEALKEIAKEFNVPVMAISHIRRLQGGDISEPTMADLQESGNIEQNADLILLLHRGDLYKEAAPGEEGKTRLIYGKYREGALGYEELYFEKTLVTFCDWKNKPSLSPHREFYGRD